MKSIIQDEKRCFICGKEGFLHDHHIFFGTANRKKSEKYGLKVWLCPRCHTGSAMAVHMNKVTNMALKVAAQRKFEETHTRKEFMDEFGKSYL